MLDPQCKPRLAAGCRFSEADGEETTLLMPERMLRLNPTALQILKLCDGRTFAAMVDELHANFAQAPVCRATPDIQARLRERIASDTSAYLEKLLALRAVDLETEP